MFIVVAFILYTWVVLTWSYSKGQRDGVILKFSQKGWICKTWEGELTKITPSGFTVPGTFFFSVRDNAIADKINAMTGKRIAVTYEQHVGVPTTCFGETEYFVTDVKALD